MMTKSISGRLATVVLGSVLFWAPVATHFVHFPKCAIVHQETLWLSR
jgi:hypothetical protein